MDRHKGVRPAAQPRTLRSIAEDKGTAPASFPEDLPYDHAAGAPKAVSGGVYADEAAAALPPPSAALKPRPPHEPRPLTNLRGKYNQ
jgi:hypothetical protein